MARCPYLDYESSGALWGNSGDKYICKLTGAQMDVDSLKVKHMCKVDYGEEYKCCPVYKEKSY